MPVGCFFQQSFDIRDSSSQKVFIQTQSVQFPAIPTKGHTRCSEEVTSSLWPLVHVSACWGVVDSLLPSSLLALLCMEISETSAIS